MIKNLFSYLPPDIRSAVQNINENYREKIIEIRLRVNQPLQIIGLDGDYFIDSHGQKTSKRNAYIVNREDVKKAVTILTDNSVYAVERQLAEGFITIPGGHRIGFTGQAVVESGEIRLIKNINCLNYRITREMIGVGNKVIKQIYDFKNRVYYNTMIVSPPLCGKTTLLRDIVRLISNGIKKYGIPGKKVGVVDERSEIGGAYNGIPGNRIGSRTDLLDNCPKAKGISLLVRSMSPEVIAVDEIGNEEDVIAIQEATNSGVSLIATAHGENLTTLKMRPAMARLMSKNFFDRFIILSRKRGIGTVEKIIDSTGKEVV
ncbi:stage III sporulation protein AA [Halothermothrix orenii]|uniref:Sporulation stage III protein AA n=1 Tax=Halothermothrix orenii (strain H 168 / OCM 544 / DSM 9562) TaxID=373903 RepID=B8D2E7_HALOH|nr:stage III sporulation protein AA [Halothermothrix orenii]ACL69374.1 Sporulation stage III protein AA [Halothermothrix orenii H 168]